MNNSVCRPNSRMKEIVKRTGGLEDRKINITQSKQQREDRLEKKKRSLGACGTIITLVSLESWKEKKKKADTKND